MSEDERRNHNLRRRMKQIPKSEEAGKELAGAIDEEVNRRLKDQNAKKAESARQRYHRMVAVAV